MGYGILAADQIQSSVTGVSLGAGNATRFKNKIINGDFKINQRGFSGTPGSDEYTLDRWFSSRSQASKYTVSQNAGSVTPPAGFINYLGVTSSSAYSVAAGDFFGQAQRIEGLNCADLDFGKSTAKTITISFWVYSSLTGAFGASISNSAGNRFYPFSYTINSANTWEQKSVTIAGDTSGTWLTTNGVGMMLYFSLGMGSNFSGTANAWTSSAIYQPTGSTSVVGTNGATWYITGVQLEVGSIATGFEYVDYGTQLSMCQRYYWRSIPVGSALYSVYGSGRGGGGNGAFCYVKTPVTMRTTPTINQSNTGVNTPTQISVTGINGIYPTTNAVGVDLATASSISGGTAVMWCADVTTSSYVDFAAEL